MSFLKVHTGGATQFSKINQKREQERKQTELINYGKELQKFQGITDLSKHHILNQFLPINNLGEIFKYHYHIVGNIFMTMLKLGFLVSDLIGIGETIEASYLGLNKFRGLAEKELVDVSKRELSSKTLSGGEIELSELKHDSVHLTTNEERMIKTSAEHAKDTMIPIDDSMPSSGGGGGFSRNISETTPRLRARTTSSGEEVLSRLDDSAPLRRSQGIDAYTKGSTLGGRSGSYEVPSDEKLLSPSAKESFQPLDNIDLTKAKVDVSTERVFSRVERYPYVKKLTNYTITLLRVIHSFSGLAHVSPPDMPLDITSSDILRYKMRHPNDELFDDST